MPQLNVASYLPQVVWLVICFVALYFLMARLALPRIAAVLEERTRRRDDDLDRAEKLEAQAEAAAKAYEQVLAEARGSAHDRLTANAEEAKARTAERATHAAADEAAQTAGQGATPFRLNPSFQCDKVGYSARGCAYASANKSGL